MTFRHLRSFICFALLAYCASPASAAILYSADFNNALDINNWTVNKAPTANAAQQGAITAFDYSVYGIPAAPGGSDTLGMRLRANVPGSDAAPVTTRPTTQATSGLSVSPTGQNFGTNYEVQFYAWSNFNGTAANNTGLADNGTSEGGTNDVMFALGTSGTVPLVVGNTGLVTNGSMDGIGFATTGDGGITSDYRAYKGSGTFDPTSNGSYVAGSNSNTAAFYSNLFGSHTAPAVQKTLSTAEYGSDANNTQNGSTQTGAFGFAWHKVLIGKSGNLAYWYVDDTLLWQGDISTVSLGGNNFALGQSDVNSTTTRHPSLLFTVFDNLTVSDVPEPSTLMMCLVCAIGFAAKRRGR